MRRLAAAALALGLAAPAVAAEPPLGATAPLHVTVAVSNDPQARADSAVVDAAMTAAGQGGLAAIAPHVPALEAVLARAPARFPRQERQGETLVLRIMAQDELDLLLKSALAAGAARVRIEDNTYPAAALLLGLHAVEMRQGEQALKALEAGLKLQPDHLLLVSEKGAALVLLRRFAEALALYQGWEQGGHPATAADQARLANAKGFVLIELSRLDEAEAAYRDALALTPEDPVALNQIAHIARLRGASR